MNIFQEYDFKWINEAAGINPSDSMELGCKMVKFLFLNEDYSGMCISKKTFIF